MRAEAPRGDWVVTLAPGGEAARRVVAFPHAGSGPAAFASFVRHLPDGLEFASLSLPGRQARFREPPRTRLGPLVHEIADALAAGPAGPVLFGYCAGTLLAYLATAELQRRSAPLPRALITCSYPAPHTARSRAGVLALSGAAFWDHLGASGGVPAELLAHPELREVAEPALKADFGLLQDYERDRPAPVAPDVPVVVLAGQDDPWLAAGQLDAWAAYTTRGVRVRRVAGGQWPLTQAEAELAAALAEETAHAWR